MVAARTHRVVQQRENLGIRLNTIPIEDSMYLLFFLLIVTTFYERALKGSHGDLPAVEV